MESRESTPSSSRVLTGIGILAVGVAAGTYAMMGSEDIAEDGEC